MIIKSFQIKQINLEKNKYILLHGKNEGQKEEVVKNLTKNFDLIYSYDEKEILENENNFLESFLNKSLFDEKKVIIIKRATDKFLNIFEKIYFKDVEDYIIILSAPLDKKSKLRIFFEKEDRLVCTPFYPDTEQTLSKIALNFINKKKISMSMSDINQIVTQISGDRQLLIYELEKIENYVRGGKKISLDSIAKLTNLYEDYSISELIDNCLAKNKKKVIKILNENNFTDDDCITISRTFLYKSKKILSLVLDFEKNGNIELTISKSKPAIFWKDKEITKTQIQEWKSLNLKILIYKISDIEQKLKKNIKNSLILITDFLIEHSSKKVNN
ncbi:DNA polymerase III subunit delta [Candidatus Pelagibacter sp.]|uniref:DNA polymerase III subunit delta n=1 Tax=Candidatus Pelagibacter sp. TaxID=2024849 RepID=UPI003F86C492